jgi:hypothetical protein
MITSIVGSSLRQLLNVLALNGGIEEKKRRRRRKRRVREQERN